jgi:ABC-type transporter Mla subunit MlaD
MSIESQGEKLERIAEGLLVKVDAMGGKIAAAAGGILGMAERVDDKLRAMNEGIAAKTAAAAKMMAEGVEDAKEQAGAFGGTAAQIAESSRRASEGFGALIGELRQQTVALETASSASRELVASISAEIARAARAVPDLAGALSSIDAALKASGAAIEASADKAGAKGREVIGHLKDVGAQFSKFAAAKASEIEFIANSQTRAMTGVAQYANKLSTEARHAVDALAQQYRDISGARAPTTAAKGSSSERKDPDLFK